MIAEFSIIIPTFNEEKFLPHLLASLARQDFKGKWEVIIVDGNSSDKTKKVTEAYKKKLADLVIISSERGVSKQRNSGAKKAKYDYFIFLDADTVVPENFLTKVAKKINPKEKLFVGLPLILPLYGTVIDYAMVTVAYNFFLLVGKFKPLVTGMCLITTKENHRQIGGFNERLFYAEDMDYGLRSIKIGAKYHMYARIRLFASVRRGRKMGRRNLGKTWLSWYIQLITKGRIENQTAQDYPYGHYTS
jgi:glycosyltransferase involved in cell wall biosynthesis